MCRERAATIIGTAGDDDIHGTDGPDVIAALGGNDTVEAKGGDDIVCGGGGGDYLMGGTGRDRLSGGKGKFDFVDGGPGDDRLDGGAGRGDVVDLGLVKHGVRVDLAGGTITGQGADTISEVETVFGSPFDDTLIGDAGPNSLAGRGGDDTITSGGGGSLECATPQPGISSFGCADVLLGEAGDDSLTGGDGLDVVMYFDAPASVTVNLDLGTATGEGTDALVGIEGVHGSRNGDSLTGDERDNVFALEGGDDTVDGAGGSDLILFAEPGGAVVDLNAGTAEGYGSDSLARIENVWGSPGDDTLVGNGAPNELRGRLGDDAIAAAAGDDTLDGDKGTDDLDGGEGRDTCIGGETLANCEST